MLGMGGTCYCFVNKISKWVRWDKVSQIQFFLESSEWRKCQERGIISAFPFSIQIKFPVMCFAPSDSFCPTPQNNCVLVTAFLVMRSYSKNSYIRTLNFRLREGSCLREHLMFKWYMTESFTLKVLKIAILTYGSLPQGGLPIKCDGRGVRMLRVPNFVKNYTIGCANSQKIYSCCANLQKIYCWVRKSLYSKITKTACVSMLALKINHNLGSAF